MEKFKEKVMVLKSNSDLLEEKSIKLKGLQEKFNNDNQELLDEIDLLKTKISESKVEIEKEAIEEFNENNTKKFDGGISIKEYKKFIYDSDKVLKIAKEKDMFLMLDEKSFKKVAEGLTDWGVEVKKEPKVTYPKVIKLED